MMDELTYEVLRNPDRKGNGGRPTTILPFLESIPVGGYREVKSKFHATNVMAVARKHGLRGHYASRKRGDKYYIVHLKPEDRR